MVTACLIRPNAVLFRQGWHDRINPIQGRNKIVCRVTLKLSNVLSLGIDDI